MATDGCCRHWRIDLLYPPYASYCPCRLRSFCRAGNKREKAEAVEEALVKTASFSYTILSIILTLGEAAVASMSCIEKYARNFSMLRLKKSFNRLELCYELCFSSESSNFNTSWISV